MDVFAFDILESLQRTMCDTPIKSFKERSTLSFGGCGFMGIYHVGVAECVQRYARDLIAPDKIICGTSAGAMIAVSLKIGLPLSERLSIISIQVPTLQICSCSTNFFSSLAVQKSVASQL